MVVYIQERLGSQEPLSPKGCKPQRRCFGVRELEDSWRATGLKPVSKEK